MSLTIYELQCDQFTKCANSVYSRGENTAKCHLCRLSTEGSGLNQQYWKPTNNKDEHPVLKQEKITKKIAKRNDSLNKRLNKDKSKVKMLRKAVKAESKTEANIIKATKNSGRSNRDADHIVGDGWLRLDTKLQTNKVIPIIKIDELDKACSDAARGGSQLGGLVIRNKHGQGFVVFREEDFAKEILSRLIAMEKECSKK